MKSFYAILVLVVISFSGINGQKSITVVEDSLLVSKDLIPGLSVMIPEVNYEVVIKNWIKSLQANTKSKAVNKNGEVSIFGARTKNVTEEPFNVYSKLVNYDSLVYLAVAFELAKDQYIERESTPEAFTRAREFLHEFAKEEYVDLVKDQVDAEDKKLKELEKELSSLENGLSRLQRSIETSKNNIEDEEENIIIQKNELSVVSSSLVEQNSQLSTMAAGDEKKNKSDQIKELEKRKKKAGKAIKTSEKRISKAKAEIEKSTNAIPDNELNQGKLRELVIKQEINYQNYVNKLKKVRAY